MQEQLSNSSLSQDDTNLCIFKICRNETVSLFNGGYHMKYLFLSLMILPQLTLAETASDLFKKANIQFCKISDDDYDLFKKDMKNNAQQKAILDKYGINYGGDLDDAQTKIVNFTRFRNDADCIKLKAPSTNAQSVDKNHQALLAQYGEICQKFTSDDYEIYKKADAKQENEILRSKAFRDDGYYKNKDKYSKAEITTAMKVGGACERIKKYGLQSTPNVVENGNAAVKQAGVDPSHKNLQPISDVKINDQTAATSPNKAGSKGESANKDSKTSK